MAYAGCSITFCESHEFDIQFCVDNMLNCWFSMYTGLNQVSATLKWLNQSINQNTFVKRHKSRANRRRVISSGNGMAETGFFLQKPNPHTDCLGGWLILIDWLTVCQKYLIIRTCCWKISLHLLALLLTVKSYCRSIYTFMEYLLEVLFHLHINLKWNIVFVMIYIYIYICAGFLQKLWCKASWCSIIQR